MGGERTYHSDGYEDDQIPSGITIEDITDTFPEGDTATMRYYRAPFDWITGNELVRRYFATRFNPSNLVPLRGVLAHSDTGYDEVVWSDNPRAFEPNFITQVSPLYNQVARIEADIERVESSRPRKCIKLSAIPQEIRYALLLTAFVLEVAPSSARIEIAAQTDGSTETLLEGSPAQYDNYIPPE